jgi:hypothetical protein
VTRLDVPEPPKPGAELIAQCEREIAKEKGAMDAPLPTI